MRKKFQYLSLIFSLICSFLSMVFFFFARSMSVLFYFLSIVECIRKWIWYWLNCEPLETHLKATKKTKRFKKKSKSENEKEIRKKHCYKIIFRKKRNFSFSISFFFCSVNYLWVCWRIHNVSKWFQQLDESCKNSISSKFDVNSNYLSIHAPLANMHTHTHTPKASTCTFASSSMYVILSIFFF